MDEKLTRKYIPVMIEKNGAEYGKKKK